MSRKWRKFFLERFHKDSHSQSYWGEAMYLSGVLKGVLVSVRLKKNISPILKSSHAYLRSKMKKHIITHQENPFVHEEC